MVKHVGPGTSLNGPTELLVDLGNKPQSPRPVLVKPRKYNVFEYVTCRLDEKKIMLKAESNQSINQSISSIFYLHQSSAQAELENKRKNNLA